MEETYSELIPFQTEPEKYNSVMLNAMAHTKGCEFWELYSIYLKQKGERSALTELDRIVKKHGITTTLPQGCSKPFLNDEMLRIYLSDQKLNRTKLYTQYYGDPINWSLIEKERGVVFIDPLRWPPESGDDFYSEKARKFLGLEYPKPFR